MQSVAAAATDYTCSAVCQLRVSHTPAAIQNLCENFHNRGGPPLHNPTVISQISLSTMTGKVPQNHQVTTPAPGPKSVSTKSDVASSVANNRSTNSPVTSKGHGSQPQGPLVATNNEGPRSPSSNKVGLSSPFSYASAVANRSKAPFSGSIECEQYRALARLGSPRESCRSSFKSLLLQPRSLKRPSARQTGVSSYSTPAESIPTTSRGSTSKQGVLSTVRSSSQTAPTSPNMLANQVASTTTPSTL